MMRTAALALLSAALLLPACAAAPPVRAGAASDERAAVLRTAERVADWQLAHLDGGFITGWVGESRNPREWVLATFYIGLARFADATSNRRYADFLLRTAQGSSWSFEDRPRHADSDTIGGLYLWTAARTGDPRHLAPLRRRYDAILAAPSRVLLEYIEEPNDHRRCQERWCWADALFVAPPVWTGLSAATGDPRYRDHADREFWATADYLYDPVEKLFFRDSRFFARRGDRGEKLFWARGNGWVVAGVPRILESLPSGHPSRPRYERLLREMSSRLKELQRPDGFWSPSLLSPGPAESSGTAFFVFAMAWGVNNGVLPAAEYRRTIERGWAALERAIGPDGRFGYVQQIGDAPDRVKPTDAQFYGTGAFLLAASEVASLRWTRASPRASASSQARNASGRVGAPGSPDQTAPRA